MTIAHLSGKLQYCVAILYHTSFFVSEKFSILLLSVQDGKVNNYRFKIQSCSVELTVSLD
jgi:hypothetical protein